MIAKTLLILLPITLFSLSFFYLFLNRIPQESTFTDEYVSPTQAIVPYTPTAPAIEHIFSQDHTWTATLSAERKRILIATGDIIPARHVNIETTKRNNFIWPYEKTADVIADADITFINLETPLLKNCPLIDAGFTFCGDSRNVEGLVTAGVDVASLANNHAGNFEKEGVDETVKILDSNGILTTGIDGAVFKNVRGVTFAFLGYNDIGRQPGVSQVDEQIIRQEITQAKKQADIVVITYHWGTEYQSQPDARQKYLGHFTIDAGADLVIGNHPHWIQPIEFYKGKLITYAHGNFVFDQMWSEETKKGVIGRYTFYNRELVDVEYIPIYIEDYGQPRFMTYTEKKQTLEMMQNESLKLMVE